jgi:hypothetical protein
MVKMRMIRKRPNLCEVKKFIQNSIWKIFFPAISPERDVDEKIEKTSRLIVFVAQIIIPCSSFLVHYSLSTNVSFGRHC